MRLLRSIPTAPTLALVASTAFGATVGCVFTSSDPNTSSDPKECGSALSHSYLNDDGDCVCEDGYDWANPDDPDDFGCDEVDDGCGDILEHNQWVDGECVCDPGYDWCDAADTSDLSCCEIGGDGDGDGDGDGGGDGDGDGDGSGDGDGDGDGDPPVGDDPDPADCTVDTEGAVWCTHTEDMGPWGSLTYFCEGGVWVAYPEWPDETCVSDGYDFGYGCVDNGVEVVAVCGEGSGEDCDSNEGAPYCVDADVLAQCLYDHVTSFSCTTFCQETGIEGVTYEFGECDTEGEDHCYCFDG